MSGTKRVSMSLPESLVDDMDYISGRLGISRSGFLTQLLTQSGLPALRSLLAAVPEEPSSEDVRRFRGSSVDLIKDRLEGLQELQGGLFDGSGK